MIIEDRMEIQAPIQEVWDYLMDIPGISVCVPGAEDVVQEDENSFSGKFVVKVGPIKANFKLKGSLTEVTAPHRLTAKAQGRDANTASMVSATFTAVLTELDEERTEISHVTDVAIRGRLGQFGQGVIRETAKELTNVFATCVQSQLNAQSAAASGQTNAEGEEGVVAAPAAAPLPAQPSLIVIFFKALLANFRNWFRRSQPDSSKSAD